MTKERREEAVIVALAVSVAIHAGLMVAVKTQVMTEVVPAAVRTAKREPMVARRAVERPEMIKTEEFENLSAKKDAPAAAGDSAAPLAPAPTAAQPRAEVPKVEAPAVKPVEIAAAVFDTAPVGAVKAPPTAMPIVKMDTPKAAIGELKQVFQVRIPDTVIAPAPAVRPAAFADAPGTGGAAELLRPARIAGESAEGGEKPFKPAEEVFAKVDEKIVAEEKRAVRALVEADDAADMVKFVNITMTAAEAGGWRYFKVMVEPRRTLKTVPKDVVMVIDGSGSIGKDRFGRCRDAARRILRSVTNTGDRFNLVVFRNAFSYAFRNWRECDAESFKSGDSWLARQTAHGRTDVFSTISSVLTLPRDPKRPLIAMVVTDGEANEGVSDTAEILSRFTALNDGLVSVYMYGVKSNANRELIDVLTHGNRGESVIHDGWRLNTGAGMEGLSERFRDPVLSDLRIVFASGTKAEAYPRLLRNLYRADTLSFVGRVPAGTKEVAFSLRGLNGDEAYEGFFKLPFATAAADPAIVAEWEAELAIDRKLGF